MGFRLLATAILVVHFGYLAYLLVGGFLAWRWARAFWPHLAAAAWGLAVVGIPLTCPLTVAENWARRRGGEMPYAAGFIDEYIENVLYPERFTLVLQVLAGVIVVGSWVGVLLLWRRRRASLRGFVAPRR